LRLASADSLAADIQLFDDLIDQRRDAGAIGLTLGSRVLAAPVRALPASIVRLVIVPDGPLHRVPFPALELPSGLTVVDRYAVSLAPSATVLAELWTQRVRATDRVGRVLAFGDPTPDPLGAGVAGDPQRAVTGSAGGAPSDVERAAKDAAETDDESPLDALSVAPGAALALPRLQWSADEARMVAAFGRGSVVRIGRDATPEVLATAPLDSFAIIHFATHAIIDEQVPARSALVLSRGTGRTGLVDAGSLESRRMDVSLIVLSACRTARGALVEGEGLRGLANPLLGSGAHAVLATQWAVGDRAAVPLVYDIYRGLASGMYASDAVRRAEAAARRRGVAVREWAAFTLIGDPMVRVVLQTPASGSVPEWVRAATAATVTSGVQ
jgi:CHAT domain-containing protein